MTSQSDEDPFGGNEPSLTPEQIEDAVQRSLNGKPVSIECDNDDGTTSRYIVNTRGGEPFGEMEVGVISSVRLKDGKDVYAWDYGGQGDFKFKDGSTRSGYEWPVDHEEEDVSGDMTGSDYDSLAMTEFRAHEYGFSSNVSNSDPESQYREIITNISRHPGARLGGEPRNELESFYSGGD